MRVELRQGARPRGLRWTSVDRAVGKLTRSKHIRITPEKNEKMRNLQASISRRYNNVKTRVDGKYLYIFLAD